MQMLYEEGIRRGISLVEDERRSVLVPTDIQLKENDFFGDEPFVPDNLIENLPDVLPEPHPRERPVEPDDTFNPRISSTPLAPNARHNLAILGLSRITESEEQERSGIEINNAKRSSHYTPTARRMIHFNVDVTTAGQNKSGMVPQQPELVYQEPELVPQQPELVQQQPEPAQQVPELPQQQPDFVQLRAEAIRRHIVNQPTPSHPRPRRRRRPRPLELWRFPVVEPRLVTEQSLTAFLYPDIPYPMPHIHLRPVAEQQNAIVPDDVEPSIPAEASAASIPQAQHSGSNVPQNISSVSGVASLSKDNLPSTPSMPIIREEIVLEPNIPAEASSASIPKAQHSGSNTQQNISSVSGIPSLVKDNLPAIPEIPQVQIAVEIIPEMIPEIIPEATGDIPEIAQLPQDQAQQKSPFNLGPSEEEKETAIKMTRFLYGQDRDKIIMIDFKDEFPTRAEIVRVFRTLLNFNGILWELVNIGNTTEFEIYKLSEEKRRNFGKSQT
ncbi:titin-like [Phlebotomus papatasi]|uniref:titin-like n=1 Tax=Phlebotomus papatasi TaxID=29031 RepID=UPI0024837D1D|nr:titin-like [Phlebotomus papatasi]